MTEAVLTHTTVILNEAVDEFLQAPSGPDRHFVDAIFRPCGYSGPVLSRPGTFPHPTLPTIVSL